MDVSRPKADSPATLVAGGGGFIGANLVRALVRKGQRVKVVGRSLKPPNNIASSQYIQMDLLGAPVDHPFFDDIGAIVHVASTTIPATSMQDMTFDITSNCSIALRLLDIAAKHGSPSFVFVSSGGTVYGIPKALPVSEDHPTDPINSYGISKLAIEKYVQLYARSTGIRGISLRVANPYGPEQLVGTPVGALASFVRKAIAGESIEIWGDGTTVRDFIHIDDVADAILVALERQTVQSGTYNVGTGIGASLNDLIGIVQSCKGTALDVQYRPARAIDASAVVLNPSRLISCSDWHPRWSLSDGVCQLWKAAEIARSQEERTKG